MCAGEYLPVVSPPQHGASSYVPCPKTSARCSSVITASVAAVLPGVARGLLEVFGVLGFPS